MRRLSALLALALVVTLGLSLAAPAARAAGGELTVFAAASLTDALQQLTAAYEKAGGEHVALNLGASSALARQIVAGAPADLFLSADEAKMDDLAKRGLVLAGTRQDLLSNTLVVVVPAASQLRLHIAAAADLADPQVHALALADPAAVPAGIYAKAYLQTKGVWETVSGRVVPTVDVRAALAAVESGNVEAGIVYKTDALTSKRVKVAFEVPRAEGPKIVYPFAVVGATRRPEAAKRLLAFLASPRAAEVFRRYGFLWIGPS
jgi:molybdate transport system substrate-binding protein